jgi:hypothetical protein
MNDAVAEPDTERLAWMYRQMLRIREFEERVKATFTEHPGVIRGHTHLADGAEASEPKGAAPQPAADLRRRRPPVPPAAGRPRAPRPGQR